MKYLFLTLFSFLAFASQAQTNQLEEVQKMISSFKAKPDPQRLSDASKLMSEVLKNPTYSLDPKAQLTQAQILTLTLEHQNPEDPMALCQDIIDSYEKAVRLDKSLQHRHDIMADIYNSKIAIMQKGNASYEEKIYTMAHNFFTQSLRLNELEVEYPRHTPRDTSLIFTSAVFAKLAGKTDAAIASFEELLDMEYNRKDLYTYLAQLYTEKKQLDKAEKIMSLMEERFGEK